MVCFDGRVEYLPARLQMFDWLPSVTVRVGDYWLLGYYLLCN